MVSLAFPCGSIHEFGCSVARAGGCVNFKTVGLWGRWGGVGVVRRGVAERRWRKRSMGEGSRQGCRRSQGGGTTPCEGTRPTAEGGGAGRGIMDRRSRGAGRGAGAPRALRHRAGVTTPCEGTRPTAEGAEDGSWKGLRLRLRVRVGGGEGSGLPWGMGSSDKGAWHGRILGRLYCR